ncbi:hypothetical protein [Herbidospora sp. NBRC 101105]|uniref:hypothetical protein n=1 Tax=Herbidospora sp. NBRC 101105 TaxID=3032195 RepID=UPI0024A50503|nr:hypothetical protein [Herbidospora sp. NBRC 101105]GLX93545.1 hypothetical protein Hesp01_14950 [Herbidospora sp. NBRC 101105]
MNILLWLTSETVVTNASKVSGVIIALIGLGITAPAGTDVFLSTCKARGKELLESMRRWLARYIPALRRTVTGAMDGALPALQVNFSGKVGFGFNFAPVDDASLEERLALLTTYVKHLDKKLDWVDGTHHAMHSSTRSALDALRLDLREEVDELKKPTVQESRYAARVDARGLLVVGAGIVLNGVPEAIATLPWGVAWLFMLTAAGGSFVVVRLTLRDYLRVRATRLAER